MKIFAVTLVLLVVKVIQGGVIPRDESISNKSIHLQLNYLKLLEKGFDAAGVVLSAIAQTEVAKSALTYLPGISKFHGVLIGKPVHELSLLTQELKWKGIPIRNYISNQTRIIYVAEQLHEMMGKEMSAALIPKLDQVRHGLQHYSRNLSLIANRFDQTFKGVAHKLEKWYKRSTPYTDKIYQLFQKLSNYLQPAFHKTKEGLKKLLTKWSEAT
ncbi:uncharacterized protein [Heterodontus francisci]|uniref:uncharacterized protein n=1 Tax=Heterodontus francisci TaxID=7792 RepID=UPI00355BD623